jgi:hypothetical protein
VLRNLVLKNARGTQHRAEREDAASANAADVPTPAALLERAEIQRQVVTLVTELSEPFRSTILLHYYEGLSAADIARRQHVPAATVRSRLRLGREQIRRQLDVRYGGKKGSWRLALLPLAGSPPWGGTSGGGAFWKGVLVMKASAKIATVIAIILVGLLAFVGVRRSRGPLASKSDATRSSSSASHTVQMPPGITEHIPDWFGQPGVPPRRIAGRVTFAGQPVSGARVRLSNFLTQSGAIHEPQTVSGKDGTFDFGMQVAELYTVIASSPGRRSGSTRVDLRDPTTRPAPDQLQLVLHACEGAFFGTVRDASGGPVIGARVRQDTLGYIGLGFIEFGGETESDHQGRYELCVPLGEDIDIRVEATGYGAIGLHAPVHGRVKRDFTLVPEGILAGSVVRIDDGSPVPGARVLLSPGANGYGVRHMAALSTIADAHGRFRFEGVADGRHSLGAFAADAATVNGMGVTVRAGETTSDVIVRISAESQVRGVVLEDGRPVAGEFVSLTSNARASDYAITQPDGTFVLDRIPHGTLQVQTNFHEIIEPKQIVVTKPLYTDIRIQVRSMGMIRGRVIHRGNPVGEASVKLVSQHHSQETRTDQDGRYECRGVPPGTYGLIAASESVGAFGHREGIALTAKEIRDSIDIYLDLSASISGTVVDQRGRPVSDVIVRFASTSSDDYGTSTTAADGGFIVRQLSGGASYRPEIKFSEQSPLILSSARGSFQPVPVKDGNTHVVSVRISVRMDRLSISGQVTDENGQARPDVSVIASRADLGSIPSCSATWLDLPVGITDVDGRFTLAELASGTYSLCARGKDVPDVTVSGIAAGQRDVVIRVPSAATIGGSLENFPEQPDVLAARADQPWPPTTQLAIVSGNKFELRGLMPGRYTVSALAPSGEDASTIELKPGQVAQMILRARGTTSVSGRALEFRTRRSIHDARCYPTLRSGTMRTFVIPSDDFFTDDQGRFALHAVPAGEIAIVCQPPDPGYSTGITALTLGPTDHPTIDVFLVERKQPGGGTIGAAFEGVGTIGKIAGVIPGGAADRAGIKAGDIVTSVDDFSVDQLSSNGVELFILDRPFGSLVKLTLARGSSALSAELKVGGE